MTFVTAELGTHWLGNLKTLKEMATICKAMGFDAVKLQALSPEKVSRHPELKYYEDASVNQFNIDDIDRTLKAVGIEWYATATYADAVEFLDPYVNVYKISVAGSKDEKLKDAVFGTGKNVLISTQKPFKTDDKRIKNLYCVPSYPTQWGEINFNLIPKFDGFSNHCKNPMAILKAVLMGAEYIEFHVTPSRDYFVIDNLVSFTLEESVEILYWLRLYEMWNNHTSKINKLKISK